MDKENFDSHKPVACLFVKQCTVLMDILTAAAEDRGPTARLYCSDGMTMDGGGGGTLLKTDWSRPASHRTSRH